MKVDTKHVPVTMVALLAVLPLAILTGCHSMSHARCEDKALGKVTSPDGKFVSITYARQCANNSSSYTWVGLQDASSSNPAESEAILTIEGFHEIHVVWHDQRRLEIVSTGLLDEKKVVTQKDSWRTVRITYKSF